MKRILITVLAMIMSMSTLVFASTETDTAVDEVNATVAEIKSINSNGGNAVTELSQLSNLLLMLEEAVDNSNEDVSNEVILAILSAEEIFNQASEGMGKDRGLMTIADIKSNLGITDEMIALLFQPIIFPDVHGANHWGSPYIDKLTSIGSIAGYPDGTFKPDKTVSKAEFFKMAYSAGLGEDTLGGQGDHWAWGYFADAYANDVVTQNEFPQSEWNDPINRYEMTLIMVRVMEKVMGEERVNTRGVENAMADYNTVQAHPYSYFVNQAYTKGLITGVDTEGTFSGASLGTRAQAATMVARIIDQDYRKMPDISVVTDTAGVTETANGTVIHAASVTDTTVFKAGDTFITANGQEVVLQVGSSGVVGEGQGLNLWESYIPPDGTKILHGELSNIEGHLGETFLIDQYGEAHHSSEWNAIRDAQAREANAAVKSGKINPTRGDSYGRWLVYGSFGWSWTGPVNQ